MKPCKQCGADTLAPDGVCIKCFLEELLRIPHDDPTERYYLSRVDDEGDSA
jgi:hypothetical protein